MATPTILKDTEFLLAATRVIASARKTIYISTFKTEMPRTNRGRNLKFFFDTLVKKAAEGVDVRLLTNKQGEQGHVPHTNAYVTNYLRKQGVRVRHLRNTRICHAKLLLVDDEMAIVGSHNLSLKSCTSNFEVSHLETTWSVVGNLVALYVKMWYSGKDA